LQFGLGGPDLPGSERTHAVHHHSRRQVVYSGTHDNDTSEGWFESLRPDEQEWVLEAVGRGAEWLSWKLVRMAFSSVAELAIVPMQDLLQLGRQARMNTPGVAEGNWSWRFLPEQLPDDLAPRIARLAELTGRSRPRAGQS
jgi:4-alpha-glucanotransferase